MILVIIQACTSWLHFLMMASAQDIRFLMFFLLVSAGYHLTTAICSEGRQTDLEFPKKTHYHCLVNLLLEYG